MKAKLNALRLNDRFPYHWEVEEKRTNPSTFLVWSASLMAAVIMIVQGGISLIAWVVRGFSS